MGMGIGINTQKPDEGRMRRATQEIACGVWFTSSGAVMPKLDKYQDEEGQIRSISQIRVLTCEKKYYCGIPIQEFRCSTVAGEREYHFRLYYYIEENRWKISWENG